MIIKYRTRILAVLLISLSFLIFSPKINTPAFAGDGSVDVPINITNAVYSNGILTFDIDNTLNGETTGFNSPLFRANFGTCGSNCSYVPSAFTCDADSPENHCTADVNLPQVNQTYILEFESSDQSFFYETDANPFYVSPPISPTPTPSTYSLSGIVYNDNNLDGTQDNGEQGYSGATITLNTGQTTTTDSNGNYTFTNLPSGAYTETLTVPAPPPNGDIATTANPVYISLQQDTTENFGIGPNKNFGFHVTNAVYSNGILTFDTDNTFFGQTTGFNSPLFRANFGTCGSNCSYVPSAFTCDADSPENHCTADVNLPQIDQTYILEFIANDGFYNFNTDANPFYVSAPAPTTLTPSQDSYIQHNAQDANEGAANYLELSYEGKERALVQFDESQIAAAVAGDPDFTATLQLTIVSNNNSWGSIGRQIDVNRMEQGWTEGNGSYKENGNRGTGSGVTWDCATDSNIANSSTNCSGSAAWDMIDSGSWPFASTPTTTSTITNEQSGTVSFDVTSDVQSFLNDTNTNDGWIIKKDNETQGGDVQFSSSEGAYSPKLIITPH